MKIVAVFTRGRPQPATRDSESDRGWGGTLGVTEQEGGGQEDSPRGGGGGGVDVEIVGMGEQGREVRGACRGSRLLVYEALSY
jgi:hypothetical protein